MPCVPTGHAKEQIFMNELEGNGKPKREEPDTSKLIQQLRVEGDAQNVTIIQQQNVNSSMILRGKAGKERKRYHVMEKMLWDLLAALPDPKLKSLNQLVISMAVDSFGNQKNAAGYLGIGQMKVSKELRKAGDIKRLVSENLWAKKTLKPGDIIPDNDLIKKADDMIDMVKSLPSGITTFKLTEEEQRLMDEGRIIVRELNRNEL